MQDAGDRGAIAPDHFNLYRRYLLAGLAGTAPVSGPAAASPSSAAAETDDAELLRLAARFETLERHYWPIALRHTEWVGEPPEAEVLKREELRDRMCLIAEQVAGLRAATVAGLRAKAGVLLGYAQYTDRGGLLWARHDQLLGWSIARDLLSDGAVRSPEDRFGERNG